MTSHPERIGSVAKTLQSVFVQTRQADLIILYLSSLQFPSKINDIPPDLVKLLDDGDICIKWVSDDLKPHKKYFYALQEYANDLIVTIDDDLIYPPDLFESLYHAHLKFPQTIIASRAHLIMFGSEGAPFPYEQWHLESDALIGQPSMKLLATGGAGALYPASLFSGFPFDADSILANAPQADDLWLKGIEATLGIPVVLCRPHRPLQYLPQTQDTGLFHSNLEKGGNDLQWSQMRQYFKNAHGIDVDRAIREWSANHNPSENDQIIAYFHALAESQKQRTEAAEAQLRAVHGSRTWRAGRALAAPLRLIKQLIP